MPCGQFPANRPNEPKSQSDIASRPLPKSPASSTQFDVVPQMIIRSSNVRPREFAIGDAKRLLQQYLPPTDIGCPLIQRSCMRVLRASVLPSVVRLDKTHYLFSIRGCNILFSFGGLRCRKVLLSWNRLNFSGPRVLLCRVKSGSPRGVGKRKPRSFT